MSLPYPPHPGFFEVLAMRRAYTSVLYLLLSLATGILAFTWAVTGLSLSLGLAILIIGLPIALAFLLGTRALSAAELGLLGLLLGAEEVRIPAILPAGSWGARLKALVADPRTWSSLLYFVLLLPLGILYFTLMVTLLALSVSLLAVPVLRLLHLGASFTGDVAGIDWIMSNPGLAVVLCGLAGLALAPLTLHLALLLGRFQIWLAGHLLLKETA